MADVKPNADDGKTTYVAKDMIWKAYCQKADHTAKNWNENWGFLIEVISCYLEDFINTRLNGSILL